MSNHYGTLSGGHYTAMCRVPLDGGREAWYSYNDEIVQKISGQQVLQGYCSSFALEQGRPFWMGAAAVVCR